MTEQKKPRRQQQRPGNDKIGSSLAQMSWEVIPSEIPKYSIVTAATNVSFSREESLIAVVGTNVCHAFHTASQTWWEFPPMLSAHNGGTIACLHDIVMVVLGGRHSNKAEALRLDKDDASLSWVELPPMISNRQFCAATSTTLRQDSNNYSDLLVVVGGSNESCIALRNAEMFDTQTNTWRCLPGMSQPRFGCSAVAIRNKVYVFGGRNGRQQRHDTAEVFDLVSTTWEDLPKMPRARCFGAAVAVGDECIVLIGGVDENNMELCAVDCFHTTTRQWVMIVPPIGTPRSTCAAAVCADRLWVFGGKHDLFMHVQDDAFVFKYRGHIDGGTVETIPVDPLTVMVSKLLPLLENNNADLPMGLWSYILSRSYRPFQYNVIYSILLSDRFQLDAVLIHASGSNSAEDHNTH